MVVLEISFQILGFNLLRNLLLVKLHESLAVEILIKVLEIKLLSGSVSHSLVIVKLLELSLRSHE